MQTVLSFRIEKGQLYGCISFWFNQQFLLSDDYSREGRADCIAYKTGKIAKIFKSGNNVLGLAKFRNSFYSTKTGLRVVKPHVIGSVSGPLLSYLEG